MKTPDDARPLAAARWARSVAQCVIYKQGTVPQLLRATWIADGNRAMEDAAGDADLSGIVAKVVQLARDLPLESAAEAVSRATLLADPLSCAVEALVPKEHAKAI